MMKPDPTLYCPIPMQETILELAIIIPACNEAPYIEQAVQYARQFTIIVIVVDEGSSDDTVERAERTGAIVVRGGSDLGRATLLTRGLCKAHEFHPARVITMFTEGRKATEHGT